MAPYPYPVGNTVQYVSMPVEIDEKTLTEIAGTTDGNYFRATSNSKLKEVYEEIDKLEKTKLNVKEYSKRDEEYHWFALAAFLCVLLEVLLRNSVLKKFHKNVCQSLFVNHKIVRRCFDLENLHIYTYCCYYLFSSFLLVFQLQEKKEYPTLRGPDFIGSINA